MEKIWYKELKRGGDTNVYIGRRKAGTIIKCFGEGEYYYKPASRGRHYEPEKYYKTAEECKKDLETDPLSV